MAISSTRFLATTLGALLLAGCAVGPDYKRPAVEAPAAFRDQAPQGERSFADLAWWDVTPDPQLRSLVRAALTDGFDARIAAARVGEARAVAAEVHGQLFPGIGYAANADRGRNALLGNPYTQGGGTTANGFDGYLGAAWELDLWGRVRRLDEQARSNYLSSEEGRRAVMLSLVADVSTAYYQLLDLDEELAIARRATDSFGESLRLFNRQLEGGTVSGLDTASAEAARATSAARIPELEREIAAKENQINLLVGRPPGPVARGASLSEAVLPAEVPAGLPSALLERRPDVREAEYAAMAANAGIGVTVRGFPAAHRPERHPRSREPETGRHHVGQGGLSGPWGALGRPGPSSRAGGSTGSMSRPRRRGRSQGSSTSRRRLTPSATWRTRSRRASGSARSARSRRPPSLPMPGPSSSPPRGTRRDGRATTRCSRPRSSSSSPAEAALAQTMRDQFTANVQIYKALGGGWNLRDAEWGGLPRAAHDTE